MERFGTQPVERLLDEHAAFVRGVARALVVDESRADDVAQDTWLAALRHPPARAGVRGWLAKVARNFSFRMRRDDTRRAAREERAAVSEIAPRRVSDPARASMLREVIDAVLALDEPYRSTLLMRYYENLDPSEIAARLGVPAATVRTRLKRGLDRLRERFDDAHGGNRAAWVAPLLPFAAGALKPAAAAAAAVAAGAGVGAAAASTSFQGITLGGILMAKKLVIAGAIAALAVVTVVIANRHEDAPDEPGRPLAPVVVGTIEDAPDAEAAKIHPTGGVIQPRAYVSGDEDAATAEAPLAPKGAPRATVSGRVVDANGAPQPNVPVTLSVVERLESGNFVETTEVSNEKRANARTGADGRFAFADVPVNVEARARARPEKLCDVARSAAITKAGPIDLGDLVAVQGGGVAGVVLSPHGAPIKGAQVRAWAIEGAEASPFGFVMMRRFGDADLRSCTTNAAGQYRIDGLPDGACGVSAWSEESPEEIRNGVRVRKNEVTWDVDFKLAAGQTLSGVVRGIEGEPCAGVEVSASPAELKLDDPGRPVGKSRSAVTGPDGRFAIHGLRQENWTIRAKKPGFITTSQRGVALGTEVALELKPSGIAFGRVRNATTNAPVAAYTLKVTNEDGLPDAAQRARVLRGAEAAKAAQVEESPDLFAIVDLPDAALKLEVRAEDFAEAQIAPVRAPSGGKVEVDVAMLPQAVIRGVVVDSAGNPVAGARVGASSAKDRPGDVAGPAGKFRVRARAVVKSEGPAAVADPEVSRSAVSGADGTFTVKSLPAGSYRVTASHRSFAESAPVEVVVKAGETADGVKLVVEIGGTFAGTAYDADGNKLAGARIVLAPRSSGGTASFGRHFGAGNRDPAISSTDGEFEITGLTPGEYLASLADPPGEGSVQLALAFGDEKPDGIPVAIEAGKTTRKDLSRKAKASFSGIVKEGGKPAPDIRVSLVPEGAPMIPGLGAGPSTKTDEQGQFLIGNVAPGEYTACFDPPGAPRSIERPVSLAPKSEARITLDLPTGAIEGRVTDRDGKPLARVTISAALEKKDQEAKRATAIFMTATNDGDGADIQTISIGGAPQPIQTDTDGRYRLRYVEEGRYKVSIRGEGVLPQSRTGVEVAEAKTTKEIDFSAEKGATLLVSVDPAGKEVSSVFVFLQLIDAEDGHDAKNGSTKTPIKFTGLKPGRYRVRADAPMNDLEGSTEVDVIAGQEARVTVRLAEQQ
jgi:RNA polymerase sigma factor (sigma-70 family)